MITPKVRLLVPQLLDALTEQEQSTQEGLSESLVRKYGDVCSRAFAARLLRVSPTTITNMIADGRLKAACEGTRIDVMSIGDYVRSPAEINKSTRAEKRAAKSESRWNV